MLIQYNHNLFTHDLVFGIVHDTTGVIVEESYYF